MIFPVAGNNWKNKNNNYNGKMKKKIGAENLEWATAHLYCKKNIVLQLSEKWVQLYCNTVGWMG